MKKMILGICLCALSLLLAVPAGAAALQVQEHSEYCFTQTDFSGEENQTVEGIFVTAVPEENLAAVMLGGRVIRPGDVLCRQELREQVNQLELRLEAVVRLCKVKLTLLKCEVYRQDHSRRKHTAYKGSSDESSCSLNLSIALQRLCV